MRRNQELVQELDPLVQQLPGALEVALVDPDLDLGLELLHVLLQLLPVAALVAEIGAGELEVIPGKPLVNRPILRARRTRAVEPVTILQKKGILKMS